MRDIWWFSWQWPTCAQTKDYSREVVGQQRGLQQGRKDNVVCISFYIGLVLNFPRVERVLVQIWQHISKIQLGIYPFVVNTFGWIGWWFGSGEFCQFISNFISWDVLVARNPKKTDLVSRCWESGIEEGNFICEAMLFPVPISDRL